MRLGCEAPACLNMQTWQVSSGLPIQVLDEVLYNLTGGQLIADSPFSQAHRSKQPATHQCAARSVCEALLDAQSVSENRRQLRSCQPELIK